jgi:hypothetical protein
MSTSAQGKIAAVTSGQRLGIVKPAGRSALPAAIAASRTMKHDHA